MPKCPYEAEYRDYKKNQRISYSCPHPPQTIPDEDGQKRCIFHSDREDKDVKKFYERFKKLYKSGKHDFTGFIFPKDFDFKKLKEETRPLKFVDAVFLEALFLCDVDLSEAEFSGKEGTDFREAKFSGKGRTYFTGAKFTGKEGTYFREAQFSSEGGTYFSGAQFTGKEGTYFSFAKFSGKDGANFTRAEFSGEGGTNFSYAEFSGEGGTYFREAQFSSEGGTDFTGAKFTGKEGTDFREAQFSSEGGTYFTFAEFSGEGGTDFSRAEFSGKGRTSFGYAEFSGEGGTDFTWAEFSGEGGTNFTGAEFSGEGGTNFSYAEFSGEGNIGFYGRTFYDDNQADLRSVYFKHPEKVTFDGVDLGRCRFLRTDISKIKFTKVYWCGRRYNSSSYFGRIKVFDERLQEKGRLLRWPALLIQRIGIWKIPLKFLWLFRPKNPPSVEKRIRMYFRNLYFQTLLFFNIADTKKEKNHYEVHRLYNQLIDNYEETNRYHEAGDFFGGMMEMRRRESFEKIRIRIALWFYRLFSLYGERPAFALGWLALLIFASVLFTLHFGITSGNPGSEITRNIFDFGELFVPGFWADYLQALFVSLRVFTFGRVETAYVMSDPIWGPLIQIIETILGAVFISLFVLSMNRKFRRTQD